MEIIDILAAITSGSLGGLSIGVTRLVVGSTDPITLGAFRFSIGSLLLLPLAWRHRACSPNVLALTPIAGLGLLYFALFPGALQRVLDLHDAPLVARLRCRPRPLLTTMLVAAILQVETLPRAKTAGVMIATVVHRSWLGPFGSVARRYVDDRSRALYGLLQCLVEGIGKAIRSDRICGPRHDIRCPRTCRSGLDAWWVRSHGVIRAYPVERCRVPRHIWWGPHVPVVVARLGANDTDTGRHLGDSQPGLCPRSSGPMHWTSRSRSISYSASYSLQ